MAGAGELNGVGDRLRQLRLAQGLSQKGLAEPSYSRAYLSLIEAGKAHPSPEALHHFADRLNLDDTLRETIARAHRARHDGDLDSARESLERVACDAHTFALEDIELLAIAGQGEVAMQAGDFAAASRLFLRAGEVCRRVTCLALAGDPMGATAFGEAALGRADRADQAFLARLHAALIMPYTQLGAFGRVSAAARHALHLSSRLDDPDLLAYVHRAVTHAFIEQRLFSDALRHADEALRLCEELGLGVDAGLCRLARACALRDEDRADESATELLAAIDTFERSHALVYRNRAAAVLAGVRLKQGRADEALALANELLEKTDPWTDGYLHRVAGMATGNPIEAQRHFARSADLFTAQGGQVDLVETCREWARLLTSLGRLLEAVEVYDRGLRGARTVAHA